MMPKELKTVKVAAGSERAHLSEEAAEAPLLLEKDGILYRVSTEATEDIWAGYDP